MSLDESKPRAALLLGLFEADGLGTDPVDEELSEEEVVLVPIALACSDGTSVTGKQQKNKEGRTYLESIVGLIRGRVDGKNHTSFAVARNER